jgi:hypothetical protein
VLAGSETLPGEKLSLPGYIFIEMELWNALVSW